MSVENKRPRLLRRLFPHKHGSNEASSSETPLLGPKPSSVFIKEKQKEFGSISKPSRSALKESKDSGLWSEVYNLFAASNPSPDLQAVAKLLRGQSNCPSSLTTKDSDGNSRTSWEWQLCREILNMAETKKSELGKSDEKPFMRQMRHAYTEIITWTQKFVALGDIISQVDPVHIGLPWAGVRAILIVVIHDQKIQAEVLEAIAYLSRLICRYAVFEEVYIQDQSLLQESIKLKLMAALKELYMAVFRYLVEVSLYLSRSSKARALRSITLSEHLKQCYDVIKKHEEEVLSYENLSIKAASHAQYVNVRNTLCIYEDYLQGEKRAKISDWISTVDYYSHHREMKARVLSETGQWFLARREFTDWIGSDQSSLLWLRGNAGTGKTSLTSCVIEKFLAKPCLDSEEALAYFYCSRTSSDTRQQNPRAILLSILRQLAAPLPGLPLKSPIISAYDKETIRGSQEAHLPISEIIVLLTELIQNHYKNVTLIIDALDECDVSGRSCLLDAFAKLTYNPITTVKTLVSSRNDPDIENHFSKIPSLSITATDNADDILKFVHKEISQRLLRGRASKQLRELVENDLNYKANGVFRWVALQVDALCDPDRVYSMEDVEYLLPRLPKTLEDTYTRILDDLEGLPPPSRKAIKNLFKLLICAEYPMSIQQLLAALAILSASPRVAWDKALILKMARGLITLELEGQSLIFAHLSVKESLEKREEFCGESAHAVAAEACLKTYLRTNSIVDQFPYFQWYAVTHLGRHCLKSGRMRQEPKLQNLMKEFLLAEDSNDAFERWNRDCFLTDVETAPGTCSERRSCQSHPGLPLFMVCVYGFDEFVESTIGNRDHVFSAENFLKQRPLEVATWYNNFNTMVKIYNAASLTHKRSIQTKRWLEAASMSGNLDVWNFAMMHVPDIPFKSVVVSAAKNLVHGKEMVSSLLNRATDIDEEILAEILRGCSSFEILDMILKYTSPVKFTEPMMEAAVQNPFINPELTEMILSNHQDLRVSETCILSAVLEAYESHSKESVIKALLNHPTRCEVTEEMIYILACFCKSEDVECLGLLLQYCVVDHITEDWLVAAAANPSTGPVILEFFLNHASGNEISQQVLQGAILNRWEAGNRLTALLSRPGCPPVLEESLYIMTETSGDDMVLSTAMEACESMHITDAYLKACAANRSRNELSQVIILPRAVPISMDAVYASTTNFPNAPAVLQFLLRIKSGFDLEESEDLFYQALSNLTEALALAHILADLWKNLPVTERSMMAAVRNHRHGTNTFKFLLQYCACVEEMFTENVLQAAIEGDNIEFVEYFKQKRPNFEVKEESLKAAINGYSTNNAILRILLSQEARCAISSSVLETAARTGNQTTLELLLEQPDASDLPSDILDLTKRKPPGVETDDTTTFEVILSAASKEGMPGEYSYELSTSKLDPLLSKYIGPAVDSGRLVEVAAERGDGKFVVQYLLSRFPETLVTRHALLAAASNEVATTSLLGLLLKHSHADVDLKLLQLAAGNKYRGTQMIELLLANRPADAKIERAVLIAAMGNPYCGRSLLKLFLVRQPDLAVTQDLVDTASENSVLGKILLQMLLKQALTLCSTISANSVLEKFKSIKDGLRDSLFMAACYGDDKILRFLMSHNVSLSSISGELGTALNVAAHAGNLNVVEILLDEGSDPESLSKLYGTPLQSACQQRNLQIVRALARHGVEIDRPNQIGRTELHIAIRNGDYEIVDALISFGASTTKRDHQGMSAMHHASLHTVSADCVNLLIKSGAPVDAEDSHQWSPLHWAAKSGAVDTVRRLLVAGVMKTKTDASGKTPFQIAMLCGNIHLRPQLLACGVSVSALDTELAGEVHQKIVCDICDLGIHGPRYKCTICEDFDLCFRCIIDVKVIHEPSHVLELKSS